jgi:hypothetical protein
MFLFLVNKFNFMTLLKDIVFFNNRMHFVQTDMNVLSKKVIELRFP